VIARILGLGDPTNDLAGRITICLVGSPEGGLAGSTLESVDRHTDPQTPVLRISVPDAPPAEAALDTSRPVFTVEPQHGLATTLRDIVATTGCDVAILSAGVTVGSGWLDRLRTAAHSDDTVVSATALSDRAGAFGVAVSTVQSAASGTPTHPRVATIGPHCCYLRRELIERLAALVGEDEDDDPALVLGRLAERASRVGMLHVLADDVLALGPAGAPAAPEPTLDPDPSAAEVRPPLRRALMRVHSADRGPISVTIDARALTSVPGGTQTYTSDLIAALAGSEELSVRALLAPDAPPGHIARFEELSVETITYEQAVERPPLSDVVHRPQQVFTVHDLRLLQLVGERIVIGQQDLIAYHVASYHESEHNWHRFRRATRLALEVADRVVFFSEHSLRDALAEEIAAPERSDVIGIGADRPNERTQPAIGRPAEHPQPVAEPVPGVQPGDGLLVCLGADYAHKNRPFAIALLAALRKRHGWPGRLVLAGARVQYGSSAQEEQQLLAKDPQLAGMVLDAGRVSDAQRAWLFEHASAIVYPSTYEGFGLLPFEACRHGLPCLYAPQASLAEHAGEEAATLVPWDAERSADATIDLLAPGAARERHLRLLREAAARARWEEVVERLVRCYERTIAQPYRPAAPYAWQEVEYERAVSELEARAHQHREDWESLQVNRYTGLPLVASGGLLSQAEQRGLMRIASRPLLHRLLLGPVGLLGDVRAGSLEEQAAANADPLAREQPPRHRR
jgi:hypothetical protein